MKDDFYEKGVDLKLLLILYGKNFYISLLGMIAGMALCGGLYFITHVVFAPAREYEAVSKLYLTFNREDDGDAYQYYNGYTWNDLMATEPIMDRIIENSGLDEQELRDSITADILSDIRLLTITVRNHDASKVQIILRACEDSLIAFGEDMEEFEKIEVIDHGQPALVMLENDTFRAIIGGGVLGFIVSLLYLAIVLVMEESIRVPADVEQNLKVRVLGIIYQKDPSRDVDRLKRNMEALGCKKPIFVVVGIGEKERAAFEGDMESGDMESGDMETGNNRNNQNKGNLNSLMDRILTVDKVSKDADIILAIPYKYGKVRAALRDVSDLQIKNCKIHGAVITGASDVLYKLYYGEK